MHTVIAMISEIGNAHHTSLTFPLKESKYAAGKRTKSCLAIDMSILKNAFPSAWKVPEHAIPNPEKRRQSRI